MYLSRFFRVSNMQGVGLADVSGEPIKVPNPDQCPADLTYFILRCVVSAVATDKRVPDKSLSLEFSLRFPKPLSPCNIQWDIQVSRHQLRP